MAVPRASIRKRLNDSRNASVTSCTSFGTGCAPAAIFHRRSKASRFRRKQEAFGCWEYDWVVEFDIKSLFDNIDHDLLMRAVRKHCQTPWALLYVERWLKAP